MTGEKDQEIKEQHPRIVFMGSPEFAVASLDALISAGFNIVAVITAPDKPAGRGMQLSESAVKQYASSRNIKILQPEKLKDPDFLAALQRLRADLQIVVAFRMLPEVVWKQPEMGTINLHGSLLPQYRGAAPINWAVINGEKETGVTTFKLQQEIDTGNILLQDRFPIGEDETAGDVHDRMKVIGARLLVKTIQQLVSVGLVEIPQEQFAAQDLRHAPKIFTETGKIDWTKSVHDVHNLIRGLSPFPAAYTNLDGKLLKIFRSAKEKITPSIPAGQYETDSKSFLRFAAADGYIRVMELQLEGKRRMTVEEFLRGFRLGNKK
jgi:methionyl-tRNA formyltransferase